MAYVILILFATHDNTPARTPYCLVNQSSLGAVEFHLSKMRSTRRSRTGDLRGLPHDAEQSLIQADDLIKSLTRQLERSRGELTASNVQPVVSKQAELRHQSAMSTKPVLSDRPLLFDQKFVTEHYTEHRCDPFEAAPAADVTEYSQTLITDVAVLRSKPVRAPVRSVLETTREIRQRLTAPLAVWCWISMADLLTAPIRRRYPSPLTTLEDPIQLERQPAPRT